MWAHVRVRESRSAACATVLITPWSTRLQVHAHSASIDHAWQALAFPWWQRWLFRHHAALSRRPPRLPADATARNLQRLLLLTATHPQTPRGDGSHASSDAGRGGPSAPGEEGGLWSAALLSTGRQRKVRGSDSASGSLSFISMPFCRLARCINPCGTFNKHRSQDRPLQCMPLFHDGRCLLADTHGSA